MTVIGDFIHDHEAAILERWYVESRRAASAKGLAEPEFKNLMPRYLRSLAQLPDMDQGSATTFQDEIVDHLSSRIRQGFMVEEIVDEFRILGRSVEQECQASSAERRPGPLDIARLWVEVHAATAVVNDMFARYMAHEQQLEKRYSRQLEAIASDALHPGAAPLRERLRPVLELIKEALGAQSAAIALLDPATGQLLNTAAIGPEALEQFVTSLDPESFTGHVAASDQTTRVDDTGTTELRVPEALRRDGIHALLGVRLPPRRALLGILYVGLAEGRTFTPAESRRLEALGERLTLHLDNAKLFADLAEQVDALRAERELRERFVSVLAHDLRGPLSAAKLSAQMLLRFPDTPDERPELAARINRNIDRTDRMVRDLLDANRIRAGERLPLQLEYCDLGAIAREVIEELVDPQIRDRFALVLEPDVCGYWSRDDLRRALWNLADNALKYGTRDRPIEIRVGRTREGAEASVLNWGAPIPSAEQGTLFLPFSRARAALIGVRPGWGLGLTLVHGCAVAHGGRLELRSDAQTGTVFKLILPLDARPHQTATTEDAAISAAPPGADDRR